MPHDNNGVCLFFTGISPELVTPKNVSAAQIDTRKCECEARYGRLPPDCDYYRPFGENVKRRYGGNGWEVVTEPNVTDEPGYFAGQQIGYSVNEPIQSAVLSVLSGAVIGSLLAFMLWSKTYGR